MPHQSTVDRRAFLAASAAGLATWAAPRRAAAAGATPGRWTMHLSTSSVQFSTLGVEQACEQIAKLGFEAVDFWNSAFGCPHMDDIQKRLGGTGLKELLAKHRLRLCGFSCYTVGYAKYAELLGKAGGGVAIRESRYGKVANLAAEMKAFLAERKPEIELAEKYDSYLAVENHEGALLSTRDSFKAFVELNASPRLGIALAPYHLQAAGIPVDEIIAIAGKQLFFFYAWQHAPGLKQLPGMGPTDCTPWLAALAKAGYARYVNPFMHGHPAPEPMAAALAKSRDYLKKCVP
jgi:sugar phosphate isomerase/epimerase